MIEGNNRPDRAEIGPLGEWGFEELQERVRDIYEQHDLESGYGPDTMLAKLTGNASTLEHAVKNTSDFVTIDRSLTNIFIWTSTFANKAGLNLQDILDKKFSQGCPHCKHMPCLLTENKECKPTEPFYENLFETPSTLEEWEKHFAEMYSNNFRGDLKKFLKIAAGKLVSEIAELTGSSYKDIQQELSPISFDERVSSLPPWESEIADVLAWGFAVSNCLQEIRGLNFSIGFSLEKKYKDGCPYCKSPKCVCAKAKTFIDEIKK